MTAKYQQIYRDLEELVNTMEPDQKLPSEKLLSEQYQVSPMTVRRALSLLISEQRIYGIVGKGTFVKRYHPIRKNAAIPSFSEVTIRAGKQPSARLLLAGLALANSKDRQLFDLGENDHIYLVKRLRLADNQAVCLEESHLNPKILPDLLSQDLTGSLYRIFSDHYHLPVASSNYTIRARLASIEEAEILDLEEPGVCLEVNSTTYAADGTLLESGHSLYRGDLYEFTI